MELNDMSYDELSEYIKTMNDLERVDFFKFLIDEFEHTESSAKRNKYALLLSEHAKEMAVNPIITMIKNPKTHNNRGTLLYALGEGNLDYSEHLDYVFSLIFDSNFEVRREAFNLVEKAYQNGMVAIDTSKKQISIFIDAIKKSQEDMEMYVSVLELLIESQTE